MADVVEKFKINTSLILLEKYLRHIGEQEGTTFLRGSKPDYFSYEEWNELKRIDEEVATVRRWK